MFVLLMMPHVGPMIRHYNVFYTIFRGYLCKDSVVIFAKMFRNGSEVQKCTAMEASDGKIFEVMTST